ncbi:MAG: NAD(P)-dependent alcohol dehydrogenase [Eggerthellaceae bacterium]|jgi:threonine dehydrogenase-like Zn-dependent dehydrogenase|nr:NAD(P)-dependent alcohol dehydrogenase [Eggerthellaceae bacterium]
MKGFAMLGIGKTGWIEKERPHCGDYDALVTPLAVSPCTSDIHTVWEGAIGERNDMILGHEATGTVIETGKEVKDFHVGDRVIVSAITPDWGSLEAQAGYPMHSGGMLAGWKFSNIKDGVFADVFHVNEADANLALIPKGMSLESATMLCDMVPTGFHGAELANIAFGDTVCVIGIGPVGLMAVQASTMRGASQVIAIGSRPICVECAQKLGATDIIDYHNGPIDEQVLALTKGKGVDRVIVAGGDRTIFIAAITMLKPGGCVGNVNYFGNGETLEVPRIAWGCGMAHKRIEGGLMPGGRLRTEKLASLVNIGRFDPACLITHTFHGKEHINDALLLMKDKPEDLIKPLVILD